MELLTEIRREFASRFDGTVSGVAAARMLVAMLRGAMVGLERELNANAAGLRTHILIALASCLFALVSFEIITLTQADPAAQTADPLRLIEAVTAGVTFLAAGSIIVSGGKIQGLTTGAGMSLAGTIGLCCGLGKLGLATMATVLAVLVLWLLRRITQRWLPESDDTH